MCCPNGSQHDELEVSWFHSFPMLSWGLLLYFESFGRNAWSSWTKMLTDLSIYRWDWINKFFFTYQSRCHKSTSVTIWFAFFSWHNTKSYQEYGVSGGRQDNSVCIIKLAMAKNIDEWRIVVVFSENKSRAHVRVNWRVKTVQLLTNLMDGPKIAESWPSGMCFERCEYRNTYAFL